MKKKLVFEVTVDEMWNYAYNATHPLGANHLILASDSLINLKKEIKNRKWSFSRIQTNTGVLSYGQNCVDEYFYEPNYNRRIKK